MKLILNGGGDGKQVENARQLLNSIAGINSNVVAKLGRDESVQLKTILKICEALNCDIGDIVEIKKEEVANG